MITRAIANKASVWASRHLAISPCAAPLPFLRSVLFLKPLLAELVLRLCASTLLLRSKCKWVYFSFAEQQGWVFSRQPRKRKMSVVLTKLFM